MKYLLLLILSLLSNAVVIGFNSSAYATAGANRQAFDSDRSDAAAINRSDSIDLYKVLKAAFKEAFVVAPRDTFPIQVGAFKNKLNADKIYKGIKNLSHIKVIIVAEEGFYKVRIAKLPEYAESKIRYIPKVTKKRNEFTVAPAKVSTLLDTSSAYSKTRPQMLISYVQSAIDTISYKGDILFFKTNSPWLKRIKYFGESFLLVNALIITILISIITMIVLLFIILLNRQRMENLEKLQQYLMEKYQNLIVDYLYGNATPQNFSSIASDNYRRQVLIDQMIDVSVNLKGEESKRLIGLYKHLGLDRDSLARARDYRWHKKIKGFRELAHMNIKDANDSIIKALNSTNEILRMEAQIALVRLSDNDHFGFLSHLKRPFSLWEQITLHDLIIQHNIPVPSFKKWLTSSNDTVVIFALRMIREFKQNDAEDDIKNSLMHSSPDIRLLAVQVAGDLGLTSTLEILKRMYKNQDYKICLEIVKTMGKMPDTSMLGFLKLVLDKEDDIQLQIEATKSIERMGDEGVKALVKVMKSEYKNYNIIVKHVLDKRIN